MNKNKYVILTGTYCSKNKGDAAMQQIMANELISRLKDIKLVIASPFPELDIPYYKPVSVIRSRRRNLPFATLTWLLLEALKLIQYRLKSFPFDDEINTMIQARIIIDLSGDMLTEDYGPLVGYSHLLPLMQAQAIGLPVAICAQTVGPFRWLKPLIKRIFSQAKLITIRDTLSLNLLAKLNMPTIIPVHTADLAFMLQSAPKNRIDSILAIEGIPPHTRPRLGVSISALLTNKINRHLGADNQKTMKVFANALDQVVEKLGIEMLLISHVYGPRSSADDRLVAYRLSELMQHKPLTLNDEYRPEEIKGVIASCDAFVGCRMHANIAALDSGIPVLAIGYSHKTQGIFNDLGLSEWVLDVNNLETEQLSAAIMKLFSEDSAYRRQLAISLPAMKKRSRQNIDAVLQLITGQPGMATE